MTMARDAAAVAGAYVLGCLNAGYYLVRLRTGGDLRTLHSGNAGATNAGRVLGRGGFVAAFFADFGKGALAVGAARWLDASPAAAAVAAVAVVAGHVWPVQLGLRGGKGVSTGLGALAALDWRLLAALVAVQLVFLAALRRFKPAGLLAFAAAPFGGVACGVETTRVVGAGALAAIVLWAHRTDIREEAALGSLPTDGSDRGT